MIDEKKLIEDLDRKLYSMQIVPKSAVLNIVKEQPKVGEWIPCSERLPEDTKTKIITLSDGSVDGGYYSEENWWCVGDSINLEVVKTENVIAWISLPEPYKEDANGEND